MSIEEEVKSSKKEFWVSFNFGFEAFWQNSILSGPRFLIFLDRNARSGPIGVDSWIPVDNWSLDLWLISYDFDQQEFSEDLCPGQRENIVCLLYPGEKTQSGGPIRLGLKSEINKNSMISSLLNLFWGLEAHWL